MVEEDWSIINADHPAPDDEIPYGASPDQVIDVFGSSSDERALIFVHGGFWRPEHSRIHARTALRSLSTNNIQCLSLEYRRIPGEPETMFADLHLALDHVEDLLQRRPTLLMGHSAGGLLALKLAEDNSRAWWNRVLALAPVTDLASARDSNLGERAVAAMFPDRADDDHFTPGPADGVHVDVIHGSRDTRVPVSMSRNYCARTGAQLTECTDVGHFELIDPSSSAWPIVAECVLKDSTYR
ncbi:MAG: hypothetical protein RJB01_1408 [Actinomycetota bacterium]|jgi:acetyl esterase/lipase